MSNDYESEQIKQMAIEWLQVSRGDSPLSPSSFFRFMAAWIAFNALYASRFYEEETELAQVKAFFRAESNRHKKLVHDSSEYRKALRVIATNNNAQGIWDFKYGIFREIEDITDSQQVASCLYLIRCNLFHGRKCPANPRDENLVQAAFEILEKIIEPEFETE